MVDIRINAMSVEMNWSKADLDKLISNNPDLGVDSDKENQPLLKPTVSDDWTQAEKDFANDYLWPRVLSGEYVGFMAQFPLYMIGHRYTADFTAIRRDGGVDWFEVKGNYALGSQGASSLNVRWTKEFLGDEKHKVFWARKGDDGQWKIREVRVNQKKHPMVQK